MEIETALADEFGLVSTRDLQVAGMSRREVAWLCSNGRLHRVARGWYVLGSVANALDRMPSAERRKARHALTARATVRIFDGRVVASHHSALVLHGLPTYCADLSTIHVSRVADDHSRARRGLNVHERVVGALVENDLVMEPAVAVVQTGMCNGPDAALVAADAALHRGLVSHDSLERAVGLLGGPRIPAVERLILRADGRAESPGETRLRHALQVMGFPVTPQVAIDAPGFHAVVDLMIDGVKVVIEFDGFVKYGRPDAYRADATPADVVVAEKLREDRIRGLGYVVVRVVWSELDDLAALRSKMQHAFALARLLPAA